MKIEKICALVIINAVLKESNEPQREGNERYIV